MTATEPATERAIEPAIEPAPDPVTEPATEAGVDPAKIAEPRHTAVGIPQHFYFAGLDEQGRVSATLWDEAPEQWDTLSAQMQAQVFEFAADSPIIAAYLRAGPWWGIDGTRVTELVPQGFEIVGGASDSSLALTLVRKDGAAIKPGQAPSLVMMGERPTYAQAQWVQMPDYEVDDAAQQEDEAEAGGPTRLKPASKVSKPLQAQIDARLAEAKTEKELTAVGKVQVVYLGGNFSTAERLAAINLPMMRDGEEAYLSGLALLGAKGEPLAWVVKLDLRMDEVILDGTVRFTPDGYTHVMYTLRYYEGAYSFIVIWEPGGWSDWSTGGDGA